MHNSKDVSGASLNVSMCLDNGHLGERGKWPLREVWSVQSKTTLSSNLCRGKKPSKPCQNVPIQSRTLEKKTKILFWFPRELRECMNIFIILIPSE